MSSRRRERGELRCRGAALLLCGCAAALGVRFFDKEGKKFVPTGKTLAEIDQIDASQLRIVADLSDVAGTGIRSVPAQVYLDASDEVGVIGTYTISVNITQ